MPDASSPSGWALCRYQVISAYLALDPPRGQRGPLREQLAAKVWTDPGGAPFQVSAETIRAWVRQYRRDGLAGLENAPRPHEGVQVLTAEQVALACTLKKDVPERSLDRIIQIMEGPAEVPKGLVKRSTLHRVLQQAGLSARKARIPDAEDLDRFEASAPNDLWQSDMLVGPWLPDPDHPGKVRRAYLYAFLDDHSRLVPHGRFSFKGDLPALEIVFRRAIQKHGIPKRCYYDNGATYRSKHMRRIVAELGMHGIAFTKRHRPMGHGKIEALNRLIRSDFLAELQASDIRTLDQLNEAFGAWTDLVYNVKVHSETGEAPLVRWRKAADLVRFAEEEKVRQAFLWSECRKPDKSGVFSLFSTEYQVEPALARRSIEVRYDPESLGEIEVWHDRTFKERVHPFAVGPHRRPHQHDQDEDDDDTAPMDAATPRKPAVDWLGHLVKQRQEAFVDPSPRDLARAAEKKRTEADDAILDLLRSRLNVAVVDAPTVRDFLRRHGPFDLEAARDVLDRLLTHLPNDHHVLVYLETIRRELNP